MSKQAVQLLFARSYWFETRWGCIHDYIYFCRVYIHRPLSPTVKSQHPRVSKSLASYYQDMPFQVASNLSVGKS